MQKVWQLGWVSPLVCVMFHVATVASAGQNIPPTLKDLNQKAQSAYLLRDYATARTLYEKALGTARQSKVDNQAVAIVLTNLGAVLRAEHKFVEAEKAYREAFKIKVKLLGLDNPSTLETRLHLVSLLRRLHRDDEANELERDSVSSDGDIVLDAFSLKGLKMGATLENCRMLKIPKLRDAILRCNGEVNLQPGDYEVPDLSNKKIGEKTCQFCQLMPNESSKFELKQAPFTIATVDAEPSLMFVADEHGEPRLRSIQIRYLTEYFTALKYAFEAKYGKPVDIVEHTYTTKLLGRQYPNQTVCWKNEKGYLLLERISGDIDHGRIQYLHKALGARAIDLEEMRLGKPASDL